MNANSTTSGEPDPTGDQPSEPLPSRADLISLWDEERARYRP